jgi:hypothetical protein
MKILFWNALNSRKTLRAEDGVRTRDPQLGNLMGVILHYVDMPYFLILRSAGNLQNSAMECNIN